MEYFESIDNNINSDKKMVTMMGSADERQMENDSLRSRKTGGRPHGEYWPRIPVKWLAPLTPHTLELQGSPSRLSTRIPKVKISRYTGTSNNASYNLTGLILSSYPKLVRILPSIPPAQSLPQRNY